MKWTEQDYQEALELHEKNRGKLEVAAKTPLKTRRDLSLLYTPGVARASQVIGQDKSLVNRYTWRGNTIAVVSDGTAILGLGDLGPEAAMPVMEGKALLFKSFGGVDAVPLCVNSKDPDEIVRFCEMLVPTFGGINLEDISAPRCFDILERLQDIGIPVFHDDQSGTAVVVCAALLNALKLTDKRMCEISVVINGAGSAGLAIARMLLNQAVTPAKIRILDSKGIIYPDNPKNNRHKQELAERTNPKGEKGDLAKAMKDADVFIGVSVAGAVTQDMVRSMAKKAIVFAMANPVPEIMPDEAKAAGAAIVGTGRSDDPNQINNAIGFPGIFRGALDVGATRITPKMRWAAAVALSRYLEKPTRGKLLPGALSLEVGKTVGEAVAKAWKKHGRGAAAMGNERF